MSTDQRGVRIVIVHPDTAHPNGAHPRPRDPGSSSAIGSRPVPTEGALCHC
ncbi:hypothetical protein [uncultured Arthrobacter sp.]|uniref:hypothetical protein n=1 Tax=uncultured Arthrobacter sp. TaxID=114050 RepID=UPI002636EC0E|nr:hypothetical protein [uncultured Arthrobacter sp.]